MKKNYLKLSIVVLIVYGTLLFSSCKKDPVVEDPIVTPVVENQFVISDNGAGTGTTVWKTGKTYILDGLVFVNDGQVLSIEAGTIIKGKPGAGENASALIVARGGKINALGTAEKPIIFTAEADQLNGNIDVKATGLWGGLIILGKAGLNSSPGESAIEGIPTSEPRGIYGGTNDEDNSGIIQYVSIRHGGTDIGEGNEINGLSLGGVGSGTVIDHVEIIANADDGVEFFGGTVECKHMIVSFCGDDCFDYDEGFRGTGQFWVAIQDYSEGDRIGEHDGGTDPETAQPYATPQIYNATYVGKGAAGGKRLLTFRDNAGGKYVNSIFVNQAEGVDIELLSGECTFDRFQAGDLELKNNIFYDVADGTNSGIFTISYGSGASANADSTNSASDFANYFSTAQNTIADPGLTYSATSWSLVPTGDVTSNLASYPSGFENVSYKGAFAPGVINWAAGWSLISTSGLQ